MWGLFCACRSQLCPPSSFIFLYPLAKKIPRVGEDNCCLVDVSLVETKKEPINIEFLVKGWVTIGRGLAVKSLDPTRVRGVLESALNDLTALVSILNATSPLNERLHDLMPRSLVTVHSDSFPHKLRVDAFRLAVGC